MFHIISDDDCKWCVKAKELLKEKNIHFTEWKASEPAGFAIAQILHLKTIPQVFYNGTLIGGYTDLVKYFDAE